METNRQLFRQMYLLMAMLLMVGFGYSGASAGTIGVRSSTGVQNSDGTTPLQGNGLSKAGADCIVQCIYVGKDGVINPPNTDTGGTTGDDQALELADTPGQFYTVIGEGYPFAANQGKFFDDFTHALKVGDKVYCRAWNAGSFAAASYYGDSGLYALVNADFDDNDFGTWTTNKV